MSFNVAVFKSQIDSAGGLSTSNKFIVTIMPPQWLISGASEEIKARMEIDANVTSTMSFFCDSTNLPGKSLTTMDYLPQGFGATHKMQYGITQAPITLTFLMDANQKIMKFFQLWLQEIVNTGSSFDGILASYKDRLDHEFSYKSNYATTLTIDVFAADGESRMTYEFLDAYPVQIGDVALGWEQNDTISKLPIEFTYSTYTTLRRETPTKVSGGRGVNLFQALSQLGTIAGVINNIRKPTSVQDAINLATNLSVLKLL